MAELRRLRSLVAEVWWRNRSGKKLLWKIKKRKKSEGKMMYYCNLLCVSSKHGIHGSLRCLKILYIHNCWNLFCCPRTVVKLSEACATRLCSHTISVGLILEPWEGLW